MDWNEFNRELQKRVSDPGTRYCLGLIYERLLDLTKQNDQNSSLLLAFAETLKDFMKISEITDNQIKGLTRLVSGRVDGVSLESVPITNDDE
jgi:hypothetical protein